MAGLAQARRVSSAQAIMKTALAEPPPSQAAPADSAGGGVADNAAESAAEAPSAPRDDSPASLWLMAARKGDLEYIRAHIDSMVRTVDSMGNTALTYAASSGWAEVVSLLRHKEDGIQNTHGQTALMLASINNHPDCASLLVGLESGAVTSQGKTALVLAVYHGHLDVVRVLAPYEAHIECGGKPVARYVEDLLQGDEEGLRRAAPCIAHLESCCADPMYPFFCALARRLDMLEKMAWALREREERGHRSLRTAATQNGQLIDELRARVEALERARSPPPRPPRAQARASLETIADLQPGDLAAPRGAPARASRPRQKAPQLASSTAAQKKPAARRVQATSPGILGSWATPSRPSEAASYAAGNGYALPALDPRAEAGAFSPAAAQSEIRKLACSTSQLRRRQREFDEAFARTEVEIDALKKKMEQFAEHMQITRRVRQAAMRVQHQAQAAAQEGEALRGRVAVVEEESARLGEILDGVTTQQSKLHGILRKVIQSNEGVAGEFRDRLEALEARLSDASGVSGSAV